MSWQRPWQEDLRTRAQGGQRGRAEHERLGLRRERTGRRSRRTHALGPTCQPKRKSSPAQDNAVLSREAYQFCRRCIADRKLDMKLVDVEILFDRSKMVFFFTAPTRIDFRDLVKDLVRQSRTRIELRQIGVRHETQMLGALGDCRHGVLLPPLSAQVCAGHHQNGRGTEHPCLDPAKISGICGRLLCCLSYEQENYDAFHRSCPRLGKRYQTTEGPMRVLRSNMFRNSVVVLPDGGQGMEMSLEDWAGPSSPRAPKVPPAPSRQGTEAPERQRHDGGFRRARNPRRRSCRSRTRGRRAAARVPRAQHDEFRRGRRIAGGVRITIRSRTDKNRRSRPAREPKEHASNDDASGQSAQ